MEVDPQFRGKMTYAFHEDAKRLRDALKRMVSLSRTAFKRWDADEDHRVGKMLNAMMGELPGYTADTDYVHTVLEQTTYLETKGPGES